MSTHCSLSICAAHLQIIAALTAFSIRQKLIAQEGQFVTEETLVSIGHVNALQTVVQKVFFREQIKQHVNRAYAVEMAIHVEVGVVYGACSNGLRASHSHAWLTCYGKTNSGNKDVAKAITKKTLHVVGLAGIQMH